MTVKINERAYEHAQRLISEGKFVDDERDAWSDHHLSTRAENEFIDKNGFLEYGKWFLGVNDRYREDTKWYYEFPYGDLENVHRCSILSIQIRSRQDKYLNIENAATDLLSVIALAKLK